MKGFNVLHPGDLCFWITNRTLLYEFNIHPTLAIENINTYINQLNAIGLGYD